MQSKRSRAQIHGVGVVIVSVTDEVVGDHHEKEKGTMALLVLALACTSWEVRGVIRVRTNKIAILIRRDAVDKMRIRAKVVVAVPASKIYWRRLWKSFTSRRTGSRI